MPLLETENKRANQGLKVDFWQLKKMERSSFWSSLDTKNQNRKMFK